MEVVLFIVSQSPTVTEQVHSIFQTLSCPNQNKADALDLSHVDFKAQKLRFVFTPSCGLKAKTEHVVVDEVAHEERLFVLCQNFGNAQASEYTGVKKITLKLGGGKNENLGGSDLIKSVSTSSFSKM